MKRPTETATQMIKRVRASVRRAQVKARKAMKAADAFSASSLERSREARSTATSTRHQPAKTEPQQ